MLQWMGGSRNRIKQTKKSLQNRQKKFFEQRRRLEIEASAAQKHSEDGSRPQSLDLLGLQKLCSAFAPLYAKEAPAREEARENPAKSPSLEQGNILDTPRSTLEKAKSPVAHVPSHRDSIVPRPEPQVPDVLGNTLETRSSPSRRRDLTLLDAVEDLETPRKMLRTTSSFEGYAAFALDGVGVAAMRTPQNIRKSSAEGYPSPTLESTKRHKKLSELSLILADRLEDDAGNLPFTSKLNFEHDFEARKTPERFSIGTFPHPEPLDSRELKNQEASLEDAKRLRWDDLFPGKQSVRQSPDKIVLSPKSAFDPVPSDIELGGFSRSDTPEARLENPESLQLDNEAGFMTDMRTPRNIRKRRFSVDGYTSPGITVPKRRKESNYHSLILAGQVEQVTGCVEDATGRLQWHSSKLDFRETPERFSFGTFAGSEPSAIRHGRDIDHEELNNHERFKDVEDDPFQNFRDPSDKVDVFSITAFDPLPLDMSELRDLSPTVQPESFELDGFPAKHKLGAGLLIDATNNICKKRFLDEGYTAPSLDDIEFTNQQKEPSGHSIILAPELAIGSLEDATEGLQWNPSNLNFKARGTPERFSLAGPRTLAIRDGREIDTACKVSSPGSFGASQCDDILPFKHFFDARTSPVEVERLTIKFDDPEPLEDKKLRELSLVPVDQREASFENAAVALDWHDTFPSKHDINARGFSVHDVDRFSVGESYKEPSLGASSEDNRVMVCAVSLMTVQNCEIKDASGLSLVPVNYCAEASSGASRQVNKSLTICRESTPEIQAQEPEAREDFVQQHAELQSDSDAASEIGGTCPQESPEMNHQSATAFSESRTRSSEQHPNYVGMLESYVLELKCINKALGA